MEIYIQSCGIASNQDYHWRKIEGEGCENQKEKAPHNFFTYQVNNNSIQVKDFLEEGEPSLLFLKDTEDQDNKKFVLLITELNAIERSKIYGRGVSNIILIIADAQDKSLVERIFNYVKYNWGEFRSKIDGFINFDETNGFIVKFNELIKYLKGLENENQDYQSKISDEIKNVEQLYIVSNQEEKTRKKSSNFLILVGVLSAVLLLIITFLIVTNHQKKQEAPSSQVIKEETCQTMTNWHPPCLPIKNYSVN